MSVVEEEPLADHNSTRRQLFGGRRHFHIPMPHMHFPIPTPPVPKLEWITPMPQTKENSGPTTNTPYTVIWTGITLRLTISNIPIPDHTISFSRITDPHTMACGFAMFDGHTLQLTTNANGEVTIGSAANAANVGPWVKMYYRSGTCTVTADANLDGAAPLSGSFVSTAPAEPEVISGASLSAASAQSGLSLTLDRDDSVNRMVSGYLEPHTVLVSDANGEPVQGAHVVWTVASIHNIYHQFGNGLDFRTVVSGADGIAGFPTNQLTAGGSAGKVSKYDLSGFEASITIRAEYNGHSIDFPTAITSPGFE